MTHCGTSHNPTTSTNAGEGVKLWGGAAGPFLGLRTARQAHDLAQMWAQLSPCKPLRTLSLMALRCAAEAAAIG